MKNETVWQCSGYLVSEGWNRKRFFFYKSKISWQDAENKFFEMVEKEAEELGMRNWDIDDFKRD